jgi:hypothetical protein
MILDAQKAIAIKTALDQYPGGKLKCQGKLVLGGISGLDKPHWARL